MIFSAVEIFEIVVTVLAIGYIFSGLLQRPRFESELNYQRKRFDWQDIKYSAIVAAPAVILHEFAHKFAAMAFGYTATYKASYFGLLLGAVLRAFGSGIIFFIPGYVSVSGGVDPGSFALVALAGPLTNLLLFGFSHLALEKNLLPKYTRILYITKKINMWLFIFNMLPIPGFDGYKVYSGLFNVLAG
jgi:Zn-dependent protease